MATRFANPFPRFFNDNAALLPSGTIDFYEAGSTVTRKDTYADPLLATANANPVVLSAGGVVPDIWLDGTYDIVLMTLARLRQQFMVIGILARLTGMVATIS